MSDKNVKDTIPINSVQVGRNGIRITWNVLAILASIGLGLYATAIIAPVKKDITMLISKTDRISKDHVLYTKTVEDHRRQEAGLHATLNQQMAELERHIVTDAEDLKEVNSRLRRLETE